MTNSWKPQVGDAVQIRSGLRFLGETPGDADDTIPHPFRALIGSHRALVLEVDPKRSFVRGSKARVVTTDGLEGWLWTMWLEGAR